MKKRFNIVIINSDRIVSFLDNFDKKIINFDKKIDFITLLDASKKNEDAKKFNLFFKKRKINHFVVKRNSNGLDHSARLEFFTQIPKNKKFLSEFIFQFQENTLENEIKIYPDGSQNFDIKAKKKILRNDNLDPNTIIDLNKIMHLFSNKKLDSLIFQNNKPYVIELNDKKFIAPHGSNFIINTKILLDLKNQLLMNLILNEARFFGPTFSRKLISERGEKWVLWLEFTWGLLFFSDKMRIYDLKRKKLITSINKKKYQNVSKLYSGLYKRFVEFNKITYVDSQKNKLIYFLKLIKQTFLLLYRGFTT